MVDQTEPRIRENRLTPEQIARSDADLRTISSLTSYAASKGITFELQGGYAVEALLYGKVTRPHNDIDGLLWFGNNNLSDTEQDVRSLLSSESTNWTEQSSKQSYLEMVGENSRRIEIYMFRSPMGNRPLIEKTIVDSNGLAHRVTVQPLEDLIASKLQILFRRIKQGAELRKKLDLRDTRDSDKDDLVNLMSSSDFDKEKCIEAIARSISRDSLNKVSPQDAWHDAISRFNEAIMLLQ